MDTLIPAHEVSVRPEPAPTTGPPHGGIDLAAFIRRYLLLLTFCMLCGIALGVLYYQKTPPTYKSKSDVLIENQRSTSISQDAYGYPSNEKTIDTHVLIIQSPLIVNRALKRLDNSRYAGLRTAKNPVEMVRRSLDVNKEGDWSQVMSLTYSCGSPTECQDILAAIVNEYGEFLGESSRNIGDETTSLITNAKDILMGQLKTKREKYDAFRQDAPLIWKDGKGVNPHRERQMEVEKKRSQLLVENSTLSAKLKNTLAALRSGGERRRAIYYEAMREINPEPKTNSVANVDLPQRLYVTALTDEYVKLRAEEHSLATKYGDGHPELADLRNRLISLRESLGLADDVEPSYAPQPDTDVESEIDYISIYVNMLNDRLATVEGQVEELNRIYDDEKEKANSLQSFQIQDEDIRKDLEATERLFDAVVSRLEEINIISENGGDKMDVLAWAQLGTRVSPLLLTSIIPGTMVGFIFGCGLSYLMERSAAMFRNPAEIRTALRVPVIGRIPIIERKRRETPNEFPDMSPMLCTVHRHGSSMAEAYRAVRTSLLYSVGGQNHQVIQVTSPLPGDGKSTLAANLAVTLANSGKRVLLVDADFRRPTLHKLFGINSPATGLVSVVNDEVDAEFAAIETEIPNVSLLPVNERTSNPAELLSNPNFKALLEQLRQQYDFVLVDTPPLLAVTDPSAVAAQVDGVLLVLRIRRGVQVAATRAREMLADVDANVLGVIVNAVDKKSSYGSYGYGYGYGYTTDEGDNPARRTERRAAKRLMVEASHVVN